MKNVTELTADSEMQCDSEKSTSSESARPTVVYQLIIEDVHSWVRLSHFTPAVNTFPGNCLSSDQSQAGDKSRSGLLADFTLFIQHSQACRLELNLS